MHEAAVTFTVMSCVLLQISVLARLRVIHVVGDG